MLSRLVKGRRVNLLAHHFSSNIFYNTTLNQGARGARGSTYTASEGGNMLTMLLFYSIYAFMYFFKTSIQVVNQPASFISIMTFALHRDFWILAPHFFRKKCLLLNFFRKKSLPLNFFRKSLCLNLYSEKGVFQPPLLNWTKLLAPHPLPFPYVGYMALLTHYKWTIIS